jgi:16S rRNA (uracil1498-N3)-methyltransferase
MHRFFIPPTWIMNGLVTFDEDTAHQIRSVLRLRRGETVCVRLGDGFEHTVLLQEVGGSEVNGIITETQPAQGEPACSVTLYQCLTQREKFEWILQKSVELGAGAITPVISERSLVRAWKAEDQSKTLRWQKIIREAAEQSRRGRVPRLNPPLSLEQALPQAAQQHELCLVPWEAETAQSLRTALRRVDHPLPPRSIAVLIGPEGGFSAREIDLARQTGAIPVTLGSRILRTETAALAVLAMIFYELGEME